MQAGEYFPLPSQDEDFDGFLPPDCEPPGRPNPAVEGLLADFERIASGVEVAWNASSTIAALQDPARWRAAPISTTERDQLLTAFAAARGQILALFFDPSHRIFANRSLDAVADLIALWAESDAERAAHHGHMRDDLNACARQLRNICHNICLEQDIEQRRAERNIEAAENILEGSVAWPLRDSEVNPEILITRAIGYFASVVDSAVPLLHAALGLDAILKAANARSDLATLTGHLFRPASAVMRKAADVLSDHVVSTPSAERIYLGLGCAASLLTPQADEFRQDRLLHAEMLLAELRAWICREELRRRDDLFERTLAARRAWEAPQSPHASIN